MKNKDILLKDICGRTPYGLRLSVEGETNTYTLLGVAKDSVMVMSDDKHTMFLNVERVKPYLFTLSSIPKKQKEEFDNKVIKLSLQALNDEIDSNEVTSFEIDFYHKNHIDWRGIIPLGLANDATNLNIY